MARKTIVVAAVLLALIVGIAPSARSQETGVLVVEDGTLIDGTGAGPVSDSVIVIENGRITAVGPRSQVDIPAGARRISAIGKFIIPGLIDGHVHYEPWTGEIFVNNGVTTIFGFGNDIPWIFEVRDAERSGEVIYMPRIYPGGVRIGRRGGSLLPSFNVSAGTPAAPARPDTPQGPEWAREAVREAISHGPDLIKVGSDNLTAEEIKTITDEAHRANLKVVGHAIDIHKYAENGFDGVAHMWGVSYTLMTPEDKKRFTEDGAIMNPYAYMDPSKIDDLIKFMVDHELSLQPLLASEHSGVTGRVEAFKAAAAKMYADPELRYVPLKAILANQAILNRDRSFSRTVGGFPYVSLMTPEELDEAKRGYQAALDFTARFAKAGGRLWLGTDGPGTVPGLGIRHEIQLLVDAGLTPMQAIQAATKNTAELFNKDNEVGTIQVGRWGDLVILDANPLRDISNIDTVDMVVKAGRVLDGKFHRNYSPPFWNKEEYDDYSNSRVNVVPVLESVLTEPGPEGATTIIANGRGFYDISSVYLNNRRLATELMNINELRAILPADERPATGPYDITVRTPWPGGGISEPTPLTPN